MSFLKDKVVLVTGAGGSIGSELCRQILRQQPKRLIMFDNSELALYNIDRELNDIDEDGTLFEPILGDITRAEDLSPAFAHRIDVIYHAAAYKHVTLCEKNPRIAHRVNVEGTRLVVEIARIWKVPTLVLVSTDKAVRPTSVMGHTKRTAESIVRSAYYTVVRLGNVAGSSGSVIPLWKEQIAAGRPVTITNPNASRYFISPESAAKGIIDASTMGPGTFVPDMGTPINLATLARMHGANAFNVVGLRSGEKLHEELFVGFGIKTEHPEICEDLGS